MFRFRNGGQPEYFIGSADWLKRNLDGRVETAIPVEDARLKGELDEILKVYDRDNCSVWDCGADGEYVLRHGLANCGSKPKPSSFVARRRAVSCDAAAAREKALVG